MEGKGQASEITPQKKTQKGRDFPGRGRRRASGTGRSFDNVQEETEGGGGAGVAGRRATRE